LTLATAAGTGNPLTTILMTQHRLGVAHYTPLRVLAYENEFGDAAVEYDQPSFLFAQFEDEEVNKVGVELDSKYIDVLRRTIELYEQMYAAFSSGTDHLQRPWLEPLPRHSCSA
jgi:hypothetical protein